MEVAVQMCGRGTLTLLNEAFQSEGQSLSNAFSDQHYHMKTVAVPLIHWIVEKNSSSVGMNSLFIASR